MEERVRREAARRDSIAAEMREQRLERTASFRGGAPGSPGGMGGRSPSFRNLKSPVNKKGSFRGGLARCRWRCRRAPPRRRLG